jgi:hypothetical protein
MASESEFKELQLRIQQLEDQLKGLRAGQAPEISADDLKAYQKVQSALFGGAGGCISECARCIGQLCITHCVTSCFNCIQRCIFECTCGPCIQDRPASGGSGRFGGLGG